MQRLGWSAIELLVQDPDALVHTLPETEFTRLHEPAYLTDVQNVRAAQLLSGRSSCTSPEYSMPAGPCCPW